MLAFLIVSFVHHAPDIALVPCMGCDELIEPHDLDKDEYHRRTSCCLWHPFHFWCLREGPPYRAPLDECGECGEALDRDAIAALLRWAAGTSNDRLHRRKGQTPEDLPPRPSVGLRLVRVSVERPARRAGLATAARKGSDDADFKIQGAAVRAAWASAGEARHPPIFEEEELHFLEGWAAGKEIVHEDGLCFEADPASPLRKWLATRPEGWREVFADWLEENARSDEARFVRTEVDRRQLRAAGEPTTTLDQRMRELRRDLRGGFCRAICL